jgi:hypothetical protein
VNFFLRFFLNATVHMGDAAVGCPRNQTIQRTKRLGAAVPSFVPTTKPYRVLPSERHHPKTLVGCGIQRTRSQFVAFRASR